LNPDIVPCSWHNFPPLVGLEESDPLLRVEEAEMHIHMFAPAELRDFQGGNEHWRLEKRAFGSVVLAVQDVADLILNKKKAYRGE
jgi:hypothetical protein